ncbi:hypothetical protein D5018_05955 [Parashewanella curva]|uniref:Uncharacterized protein n=1 Tax=Parashewanella curva TaxID=2338552 RepID=A0A3L8Q1N2_9GAMM|nr:hypothetical protein [Parashewanella curva]RLV60643.1 hypothetical protein D5018_05955 [Parashewanella curva]
MKRLIWMALPFALFSLNLFASDLPCNAHTQMTFTSKHGNWVVRAEHVNQIANIVDLDDQCSPLNQTEPGTDPSQDKQEVTGTLITPTQGLNTGQQLGDNEDFDTGLLFSMAYQPKSGDKHEHPAPVCLVYIAAHGPGDPETRVIELNGARCILREDGRVFSVVAE